MTTRRQLAVLLATVAIAVALISLPVSIFISGLVRNEQTYRLCQYSQRQWRISDRTILRFTGPGTEARHDAFVILGPKPRC